MAQGILTTSIKTGNVFFWAVDADIKIPLNLVSFDATNPASIPAIFQENSITINRSFNGRCGFYQALDAGNALVDLDGEPAVLGREIFGFNVNIPENTKNVAPEFQSTDTQADITSAQSLSLSRTFTAVDPPDLP